MDENDLKNIGRKIRIREEESTADTDAVWKKLEIVLDVKTQASYRKYAWTGAAAAVLLGCICFSQFGRQKKMPGATSMATATHLFKDTNTKTSEPIRKTPASGARKEVNNRFNKQIAIRRIHNEGSIRFKNDDYLTDQDTIGISANLVISSANAGNEIDKALLSY